MGLSINKIRQTITNPDDVTRINLNKVQEELMKKAVGKPLHVGLYLKQFQKEDKSYYVFVNTREPSKSEINIVSAYILTQDIIPNLSELSLIEVLRRLTEIFGEPMDIQGKIQTFFYREVIPMKTQTQILRIPKGGGEDIIHAGSFIKIVSETNELFCALAYSLNETKYLAWLKENY